MDDVVAAPLDPGFLAAMEQRVVVQQSAVWYNQRPDSGFVRIVTGDGAATGAEVPAGAPAPKPDAVADGSPAPPKPKRATLWWEQRPGGFQKVRVGGEEGEARKKESLARIRTKSESKPKPEVTRRPATSVLH